MSPLPRDEIPVASCVIGALLALGTVALSLTITSCGGRANSQTRGDVSVGAYAEEFRARASAILSTHPEVHHAWRQDGTLVFPASSPAGFEVTLQPEDGEVSVFTSCGFHEHFEGEPLQAATDALALTRDLLSPDMRVRELRAGGGAYRWVLERRTSGGWTAEASTGLFFWNWFGRRSERVYQNTQLPGRLLAEHQG